MSCNFCGFLLVSFRFLSFGNTVERNIGFKVEHELVDNYPLVESRQPYFVARPSVQCVACRLEGEVAQNVDFPLFRTADRLERYHLRGIARRQKFHTAGRLRLPGCVGRSDTPHGDLAFSLTVKSIGECLSGREYDSLPAVTQPFDAVGPAGAFSVVVGGIARDDIFFFGA